MWARARAAWLHFYERQCATYPVRWYWPIVRIYGGPAGAAARTCYLTRVVLTPETRWGQLYFHIFHREDIDRDPHDHPFDFRTFPLQGYTEEVYSRDGECFITLHVPRLKWSRRAAVHTHRITSCDHGWPLHTLVWHGPSKRKWGFWCHTESKLRANPRNPTRTWVPWQAYVWDGQHANVEGQDNQCPGT